MMDKNALWKWLSLILLTAFSLALVWPPKEKIKLGLDLRGGTSFVLQVVMDELDADARKDAPERALEVIRNRIDATGTREPLLYLEPKQDRIILQIPDLKAAERDEVVDLLERQAFLEFRMVHEDNDDLVAGLFSKSLVPPGYKIVSVDDPGFDGRSRSTSYYKEAFPEDATKDEVKAIRDKVAKFQYKAGHVMMLNKVTVQGQDYYRPYYVNVRPKLTGDLLENAGVDYQQLGQPIVTLKFNAKGAKRFARVTADYAPGGQLNPNPDGRRYMGIVLDGQLYSAPFLRTAIYGGEAIIEGNFSQIEAQQLSIVLRAGSLPAPIKVVEERIVDPTLGRDSIESGTRALMYGAIAVVVFMIGYYLLAGTVAVASLGLDLLLLPFGMILASGFLGMIAGKEAGSSAMSLPTLTLPGIAGIVLTIGMAVDANVLIFERIREEQRAGKRFKSAIDAGYDKAFSTIFDANITTLITAVILFWQGSGPIRGFAVTLSAGIIVSMYVALVITRLIFNALANHTSIESLTMLHIFKNPNFNFVGKRKAAGILSAVVIAGAWFMFFQRGVDNFGVDFTGGRAITWSFTEKAPVEDVRAALDGAGLKDALIQYQQDMAPDAHGVRKQRLEIKVGFEQGDQAKAALSSLFESHGFKVMQEDSVGPQIGEELQKKGLWAIGFAMLGIVLYISWRFEFAFAIGAIVAVSHDVLVTVGIYCLFGRQLSLPIVAALLTIVGYSVNDTIVVFDRIREDLKLMRGRPYVDIANISINQTLSRTVLTSVTTLITVVMLLLFGGGAINDFALALFIGIIVGTYSSIFVATPVMLLWHRDNKTPTS